MDKFNLENQYQLFLKRMALNESKMHTVQKIQLRQAFFGAIGQILILFKEDISANQIQDLFNQVHNFFLNETNRSN